MASNMFRASARTLGRLPSVFAVPRRGLPMCSVETNLKSGDIPTDFSKSLSRLIARTLDKPEKLVSVSVQTDKRMMRNSDDSPTATVHIWSVGVFNKQSNPRYAEVFFEFLKPQLNMSADRIAVFLHPIEREEAAHLLYADLKQKQDTT